jgi:hypothetical protein
MAKKRKLIFILIAVSLPVLFAAIIISNPLRRSEERIRADLLSQMPIGGSMDEVIAVIEKNDRWSINHISKTGGVFMLNGRPGEPSHFLDPDDERNIGKQRIRVHLGYYRTIFITDVLAFFAFDADGYLIEIAIRKDTDAL